MLEALRAFGAPLHDLTADDLARPGVVFQIGVPPLRIDVLTAIDGVEFDPAWATRDEGRFDDQPVFVISRALLVQNKRAAGRAQDLADIERLVRDERSRPDEPDVEDLGGRGGA